MIKSILDSPEAQAAMDTILRNKPDAGCRTIAKALAVAGIAVTHTTVYRYMRKQRGGLDTAVKEQLPPRPPAPKSAGKTLARSLNHNFQWVERRIDTIDLLIHDTDSKTVAALTNSQRQLIELKLKLLNLRPAPELLDFVDKVARALERATDILPDQLRDQVRTKIEAELYRVGFFDIPRPDDGEEAPPPVDGGRGDSPGDRPVEPVSTG